MQGADVQGIWEKEMVGEKWSFEETSVFWNLWYASVPLAKEEVPELFRVFLLDDFFGSDVKSIRIGGFSGFRNR